MTSNQYDKFKQAIEAAEIASYCVEDDISTTYYDNGVNAFIKKVNDGLLSIRSNKTSMSHPAMEGNVLVSFVDFTDIHSIKTTGSAEQIKTLMESLGASLSDDEYKLVLEIDKHNYDIKPITGDYVSGFKYLSPQQYADLTPEEQEAYDEAKAKYEEAKEKYLPVNQAASITFR